MPDDISNSSLLSRLTMREFGQMLIAAFVVGGVWISLNSRIEAEELATVEAKTLNAEILKTQQQYKLDISEIKNDQEDLADDVRDLKKQVSKDNDEIKAMLNKLLDRELQR